MRIRPALEAWRRTAEHDDRPFLPRADDGHLTRMVARRLALLVRRFVLFVDDDGAEVLERREHRRPRANGNALGATAQREPFVVALAVAQCAVQDGDAIAEDRAKAVDRLRRERDLGHQNDRRLAALVDHAPQQLDVDQRLAAAGDAVKKKDFTGLAIRRRSDRVALSRRRRMRRGGERESRRERIARDHFLLEHDEPSRHESA